MGKLTSLSDDTISLVSGLITGANPGLVIGLRLGSTPVSFGR